MNKPNMYRVNYLVMEGDNYAGGWGKRHSDIKHLHEVSKFSNVESVMPIFIEIGEPMQDEIIQSSIDIKREQDNKRKKVDAVLDAENRLREAKNDLNS